jgi:hypothetical protein
MTKENKKSKTIKMLRNNNFNCFPIPYGTKEADSKYDAARTKLNQTIGTKENFGYIPTKMNCIIDLDHIKYNETLDKIAKKFMVVKTAHNGRHLPVINLGTDATKIELFDYSIQDKKIIEIQGNNHYCVGVGSVLLEDKNILEYTNIGTDILFDANGQDFDSFVDYISKKFKVVGKKKTKNQNYLMRQRFKDEQIPTKGTSNDYFFNAALQCNTDELTKQQSIKKIQKIYEKWENSPTFSGRTWSNIESKIDDVYENDYKITKGRKEGSASGIDRTEIAQGIIESRHLYSDIESETIYENKNGFLEPVNGTLRKELQQQYPTMEKSDFKEIESKILGLVPDIPPRNKDLIVFKNGIYSLSKQGFIETDDIAYIGFRDYDYIKKPNPKKFLEIMFGNVPKSEHGRLKTALASVLKPYLDPKLSVIHGLSGVGKSTGLSIIAKLLGQYAMVTELNQLLNDRATKANLKGKLLLIIQELPNTWKNLNLIKIMLGEQRFSGRKNHGDHDEWDNTLKAFSSANYLPAIPEEEQNAMHSRRLSLIHNTRTEQYPEDPTLEERIIEDEGSKILSYLVNLMKGDYKYENKDTNQEEWEKVSNPEDEIIKQNYTYQIDAIDMPIFHLIKSFKEDFKIKIAKARLEEAFQKAGYNVYASQVKNMTKVVPKIDSKVKTEKILNY